MRTALLRIARSSLTLFAAYSVLMCFPEPFFSFSVRADNLILHADRPFTESAAKSVLDLAQAKLKTSPLYSTGIDQEIFICNARWRQRLFFNWDYGVAGVAPYFSPNVFLRDASIDDDRLISPRGTPVRGDRSLDYFVAHEITHQLTFRALGRTRAYRMPQWVREGYADYVAKGASFHYDEARGAFLAEVPEMNFQKSGLYWRFNLLVAHVLELRHWTVMQLLEHPPQQEAIEAEVRMGGGL